MILKSCRWTSKKDTARYAARPFAEERTFQGVQNTKYSVSGIAAFWSIISCIRPPLNPGWIQHLELFLYLQNAAHIQTILPRVKWFLVFPACDISGILWLLIATYKRGRIAIQPTMAMLNPSSPNVCILFQRPRS